MLKENGRFKKTDKEELAHLKGKRMVCPVCNCDITIVDAKFSDMLCIECGSKLEVNKATGKR